MGGGEEEEFIRDKTQGCQDPHTLPAERVVVVMVISKASACVCIKLLIFSTVHRRQKSGCNRTKSTQILL